MDLDVLDPSCFPGTGTPEPGGISFGIDGWGDGSVLKLNVIGCDVTELSPSYDSSGVSMVACKILRKCYWH
ncbi:MAG: arginase family protein [Frisingicoccus sp.]